MKNGQSRQNRKNGFGVTSQKMYYITPKFMGTILGEKMKYEL
jgi:hypothetical protein